MMLDIRVQEDVFRCTKVAEVLNTYKNATPDMFIEMEEMSHIMYKKISALSHEKKKKDPDYFPYKYGQQKCGLLFV